MTNHQYCQLMNVALWNENAWSIVHAIEEIGVHPIPTTGLALDPEDFTIELSRPKGDKHYSSRCYEKLAQETLERLLVCP